MIGSGKHLLRRWWGQANTVSAARYKYIHMEEMMGNVAGARQIFERWMAFEPDHHGWLAYVKVRLIDLLAAELNVG